MESALPAWMNDLEDLKKDPRNPISNRRSWLVESWTFMKERKKYWLLPFVITVLLLSLGIWTAQPVVAPPLDSRWNEVVP